MMEVGKPLWINLISNCKLQWFMPPLTNSQYYGMQVSIFSNMFYSRSFLMPSSKNPNGSQLACGHMAIKILVVTWYCHAMGIPIFKEEQRWNISSGKDAHIPASVWLLGCPLYLLQLWLLEGSVLARKAKVVHNFHAWVCTRVESNFHTLVSKEPLLAYIIGKRGLQNRNKQMVPECTGTHIY